ncbi:MAG: hypothetical protein HYW90_04070 [Candidatus Sungbacteria bacterium]|nr:hypothetical protein [Candidatus Sungbacteria bacterium]
MPYVPSQKTIPPAEDRKVIDAALEPVVHKAALVITRNSSLKKIYRQFFIMVARDLWTMLANPGDVDEGLSKGEVCGLARAIYETGAKYGYEGAFLGELNYAITRFIQRVPQVKVAQGAWKDTDELRYWLYAETVAALIYASRHTEDFDIAVDGVFIDIKDEYKWRVNRSYETLQIIKSGDCYDTPYYNKPVEVVNENGSHVGYVYVDLKRSDKTLHVDVLQGRFVLYTVGGKQT